MKIHIEIFSDEQGAGFIFEENCHFTDAKFPGFGILHTGTALCVFLLLGSRGEESNAWIHSLHNAPASEKTIVLLFTGAL